MERHKLWKKRNAPEELPIHPYEKFSMFKKKKKCAWGYVVNQGTEKWSPNKTEWFFWVEER